MAAMMIDDPLRAPPKKNMTVEIKPTPEPSPPQSVKIKVEQVAIKIPKMKTGERIVKRSVDSPMRMLPKMAPRPKRLKIFADISFEKSRAS